MRQRQVDLCEIEAGLVYKVSFRTARATQRNPVLKRKEKRKKEKNPRVYTCYASALLLSRIPRTLSLFFFFLH